MPALTYAVPAAKVAANSDNSGAANRSGYLTESPKVSTGSVEAEAANPRAKVHRAAMVVRESHPHPCHPPVSLWGKIFVA
jgi:hypothetical protein